MQHKEMDLQVTIEQSLHKKVTYLVPKGQGMLGNAFLAETEDGKKYILKTEREDNEESLIYPFTTEAAILQKLNKVVPTLPVPKVVFVKTNPDMYCYEYIEGEMMIDGWKTLAEEEQIALCKELGIFYSNLGKAISKNEAIELGVNCNENSELDRKVKEDYYDRFMQDEKIPEELKIIANKAYEIYNTESRYYFPQFIHGDSHHENIIIKDRKLSAVIDFGDCEYTDMHKEFAYYIRQMPDFFEEIVKSYEMHSGNKLSLLRLVSWATLWDLEEIRFYLVHTDSLAERMKKESYIDPNQRMRTYEVFLNKFS